MDMERSCVVFGTRGPPTTRGIVLADSDDRRDGREFSGMACSIMVNEEGEALVMDERMDWALRVSM